MPRLRTALREMSDRWFKVETVIVEPGVRTGMPIHYDNPKEVGADRIADAVAAFERYGGPTIVVDFGTATTFEVVSAQGRVPRRHHRARASRSPSRPSSARAALLPRVELVEPRSVLAKNTVESVQSGVIYGFAAQVDGLCRRLEEEVGPVQGGGDRRPGRADRAVLGGHRAPRAVADPRRPAHHLRAQRAVRRTAMTDVPYRFERDATAGRAWPTRFAALAAGGETGVVVSVAGRLMLRREMGKLAFGTLRDSIGRHPAVRRSRAGPTTSTGSAACPSATGSGPPARWCEPGPVSCR